MNKMSILIRRLRYLDFIFFFLYSIHSFSFHLWRDVHIYDDPLASDTVIRLLRVNSLSPVLQSFKEITLHLCQDRKEGKSKQSNKIKRYKIINQTFFHPSFRPKATR